MRAINEMDIRFLTRVRTGIEIDMAKDLYALFDDHPIIDILRDGVHAVMDLIAPVIDYASPAYTNEVNKLVVFKRRAKAAAGGALQGPPAVKKILAEKDAWSASDCSDLIRLMATMLEEHGKGIVKGGQGFAAGQAFVQKHGALSNTFKPDASFHNVVGPKSQPDWSGRSRVGEKDAFVAAKAPGYVPPARHIIEGRNQISVERLVVDDTVARGEAWYGIRDTRLMPESTVRKISIAFGLPQGADISGTTADSVIMYNHIKTFTKAFDLITSKQLPEPVLQLLPLATMVSLGHHTVLESALTLTLSHFINYSIGFYSTLMPNPTDRRGIKEEVAGRMMRILRKAESHHANIHFICFYNEKTRKYEGQVFESDAELELYRIFSWVADPFREQMAALSPEVRRAELMAVVESLGHRKLSYSH